MKISKMRELSLSDIKKQILKTEENIFIVKCNKEVGRVTDTSIFKKNRKILAQMKTIANKKTKDEYKRQEK